LAIIAPLENTLFQRRGWGTDQRELANQDQGSSIHEIHHQFRELDSGLRTPIVIATKFQTADEMRDMLAHIIAGVAGGAEETWRERVSVEKVPIWKFVRHNWLAHPRGTAKQRGVIEKAVEIVRAEHPYVI
jgi:hypothetical protein